MSMTSTSFNVGLAGDGARSSSRVLRPPGGGHTDIFGGEPEPTRGRRQGYAQPPSSIGEHDPDSEPQPGKGRRQGYPQSNNFGEQTIGVSDASEQIDHYGGFAQPFSADDIQLVKGKRHFTQPTDSIYPMSVANSKLDDYTQTVDALAERPTDDIRRPEPEHGGRHGYAQLLDSMERVAADAVAQEMRAQTLDERPPAGDFEKHDLDRRHYTQPRDAIYQRKAVPSDNDRPEHKLDRRHFTQPRDAIYPIGDASGKRNGYTQTSDDIGRSEPVARHGYVQPFDSYEQAVADGVTPEPSAGKTHECTQTLEERPAAGDIETHNHNRRHYIEPRDAIYERPTVSFDERPEHKMDRRHFASPHDGIYEHPSEAKTSQSSLCEQMTAGQCWTMEPAGRRQHTSICGIGMFDDDNAAPRGRRQFAHAPSTICEQPLAAWVPEPPRGKRPGPPPPPTFGQGDEPKPKNGIEPQNGNVTPEQPSAPEPTPEPVQEARSEPISPVGSQPEPAKTSQPEPARASQPERAEAPKRVRVPPGGFSSGLW